MANKTLSREIQELIKKAALELTIELDSLAPQLEAIHHGTRILNGVAMEAQRVERKAERQRCYDLLQQEINDCLVCRLPGITKFPCMDCLNLTRVQGRLERGDK